MAQSFTAPNTFGFLAKAAAGFVAAHHATHQGTGEGEGGIGELLDQAFASLQKMFRRRIHGGLFLPPPLFHIYI